MKAHDSVKAEAHMLTPAQQKVAVHTVDPLPSRFSAVQPRIHCCDTTMGSKVSGDQTRWASQLALAVLDVSQSAELELFWLFL